MTEQLSALEQFFEEARTKTDEENLLQGMIVVGLTTGATLRGRVERVERGMATVRPVMRQHVGYGNDPLVEAGFPVHVATEHVVYARHTNHAKGRFWA